MNVEISPRLMRNNPRLGTPLSHGFPIQPAFFMMLFPWFSHGFSPKDAIDLCQVAVGGYAHLWNQRSQWPRQVPQICDFSVDFGDFTKENGDFMGFSMGFSMGCMG